ncbi:hypothetical protein MLD38_021203 [Melastoma candidum]|uniref:Uncharacterized protein n=1 Tax=Melastoma candidum TaxID=119954 RepID=A0ACB9QIR6_9MYRT|nr:hypothetical protein MLD38_021203 [Melastoma candidum]
MEKEPLLHHPLPPPILCPLPEDDAISIPIPLTPSELKDRLVFGPIPSPQEASSFLDSLCGSPRHSPSSSSSPRFNLGVDSQRPKAMGHLHRSKTAPAMAVIRELNRRSRPPSPGPASRPVLRQGAVLLGIYLSLGVVIYWLNRDSFSAVETHPVVDALYFCIVTMCTIGYGDITPNSTVTKLFSIMFVLVGFGFIDILLSGMVSYVLDLQESYLLKAAKDRSQRKDDDAGSSCIIDLKKGRMRIRMKVGLALGIVVLCIGIGLGVMHFVERLGWLDSLYLSVMSVTTVGYGDRAFETLPGRAFASVWLLVSTLAVARAFLYLAEARIDKRQRRLVKWVLGHDMTVSEFLAADTDYNGLITKSEYVLFKLKEMGRISEKDILQVCNKFDRLDTGNCGKISLADLLSSHR